jgi:cholest-4-en-3-one 26-monooxygenase
MVQLAHTELGNPDTYVSGPPHDVFRSLRREEPVSWQVLKDGSGFWAATKYDDATHISQHPEIFSSAKGTNVEDNQGGIELMMVNMDAPRHTKLRGLVSKGFTPKMVRAMEPHVREVTTAIIDKVAPKGECDFVTDIAAELPLQVIAELIGIPQDDRHKVFDWSNRMIGLEDPEYGLSMADASQAAIEILGYAGSLSSDRRQNPKEDLISVLVEAEVDGHKLEDMELNFFFLLLAVAGNETTRNLISGGMLALMENPDQREKLMADRSLLPTAVEEMLRWVTPVMYFRRTATQDTELRGQKIQAGEKVTIWYIAANRDEDVFSDAGAFEVSRDPNPHLAFGGGGPHFCLGASLARLEIRLMFEELLRRLPDIEQTGPVSYLRSNFISGIKHMPVRFTPEGL